MSTRRTASTRKRRAFGPRRSSRFVPFRHWARMNKHRAFGEEVGRVESFSFVMSPLL